MISHKRHPSRHESGALGHARDVTDAEGERQLYSMRTVRLVSRVASHMAAATGPVEARLRAQITAALSPVHIELVNESFKHSVPAGSESHFKVLVVSAAFEGKSPLQRHRAVNAAVAEAGGGLPVHALSVSAKTPQQWADGQAQMQNTPNCKGTAGM